MTSKNVIPENFIKLHEGEESLRKKSLESINSDREMPPKIQTTIFNFL